MPSPRSRIAAAILATTLAASLCGAAEPPVRCAAPEHRQFDFWIGDWEVRTPDGKLAGRNRIEAILGGCVLRETWTGASGMEGTSLNIHDAGDSRWHQLWVDSNGLRLPLAGGLEGDAMVMTGETRGEDGGTVRHEIRWTPLPDGRVEQRWRTSEDGGATWRDAFVGLYARQR